MSKNFNVLPNIKKVYNNLTILLNAERKTGVMIIRAVPIIIFTDTFLSYTRKIYDKSTTPRNIERMILTMIIVAAALIIFMAVFVLDENLRKSFTEARQTILTVSTTGMVVATLILALGTFKIIMRDRERENRDRKERYLNEILEWLKKLEDVIFPTSDPNMYKGILGDRDLTNKLGFDLDEVRLVGIMYTPIAMHNIRTELRNGRYFSKLSFTLDSALGKLIDNTLDLIKKRRKLVIESGQYPPDTVTDITEKYKTGEVKLLLDLVKDVTKSLDGLNLSEKDINDILTGRNAGEIISSIRKAIDKIIEIKCII